MALSGSRAIVAVISALALSVTASCTGSPNGSTEDTPAGTVAFSSLESGGGPTEADPTESSGGLPGNTVEGAALQQADLERLGVTVVADDRAAVADGTLTFSQVQVERMLTEQSVGGGVLGSDLDAIAPMSDSLPPASHLLQAWLAKGTSAAAEAARTAMGDAARATTGIPEIVYPTVVVVLFVADLGAMVAGAADQAGVDGPATTSASGDVTSSSPSPPGLRGATEAFSSAPCTVANDFIARTIKGVFDLLKLDLPSTGGFFGAIVGTLAAIWNYAVELARGVVTAVVGAITEEIFAKIRVVAAGLGAASILISYLKGQQLIVTVDPLYTRVAIGGEPDIAGQYIARAHPLSELWPPALMDCVTAAGGKMPELMLPGAVARWTLIDPAERPGLVVPASLTSIVRADHRAYLDFVTGREPAEWATGPEMVDGPAVRVEVEQKGITDFLRESKESLLGDLKGSIVGLIPIAQVRAALLTIIGSVLDPIAARIEAELNATVGGMFTLKGAAVPIGVTYHRQPDDPAPAPPPGNPPDPFCDRIRDLVAWADAHAEADVQLFSAEILGRLIDARTVAPPQMLGPVDAGIPVYQAGSTASALDLAAVGLDGLREWADASVAILGFCKIPTGTWTSMPTG